jgi:hypothetical protein
MTFNNEIEKTKQEIEVLTAKLELLKEMEKHKSPCEEAYKRVYGFYPETYEDSWSAFQDGYIASQKDYKVGEYQPKEKEQKWDVVRESVKWCEEHPDESVEDYLTPQKRGERVHKEIEELITKIHDGYGVVEYPYKKQTPEEVAEGLRSAMMQAKEEGVFDEVEWDEKDTPNLQKIIDKMVEERKSKKLHNMLKVQLNYDVMVCDDIVDIVEDWILEEQNASGSQNLDTELLVEGFNDCVRQMKEMLR